MIPSAMMPAIVAAVAAVPIFKDQRFAPAEASPYVD
jgi:hypothetical protein